jgi:hypothetical protein
MLPLVGRLVQSYRPGMQMSSLLPPLLAAPADEPRSVLVAVAPAAVGIAVLLVLLTAVSVVALVIEVRRDGYGLERPRSISPEFPWQTEGPAPRRRTSRRRDSWSLLRTTRALHR